ncbi:MAG: hypothetical protein LRY73_17295 [Bacillus sp. (in: Bacteria)]|nr:hypothetical protein [Bacillus sp. (in: firmicutes)]
MKYEMDIIDGKSKEKRRLWIEEEKVRYSGLTSEHTGMYVLNTDQFHVVPGNITISTSISEAFKKGNGLSSVKQLLLFGFTSFIQIIEIDHERTFNNSLQNNRKLLKECPLDHIYAVQIPIVKLTDSFLRKVKQESIPIIFLEVESIQDITSKPWKRICEAMFPKRILIVCKPSPKSIVKQEVESIHIEWENIVRENRLNSFFHFPVPGEPISDLLQKRIGLFPKKGSLVMGSDADYCMYGTYQRETPPIKVPDIVVLKGKVVKAGKRWMLDGIRGEEMTSIVPEQFLPIQDIYRYED